MKKIVIIGGGIAGKTAAAGLSVLKEAEVTLIEPKEYMEVPYAQLRALVDAQGFSPQIRKPYSLLLPQVKHIQKKAKGLEQSTLILDDESSLSYDYLVIATGSRSLNWSYLNSGESNMEKRQEDTEIENRKLQNADSVAVIGAGAVGVELAGEIAYRWPEKKITILNSADRILSGLDEKMSVRAGKLLNNLGVEIKNTGRLIKDSDGTWLNSDGSRLNYDIVYPAVGMKIETDWIGDFLEKTDRGAVRVDKNLRAVGKDNIFILGDINDVPEIKLGALAGIQASITVKNIKKLINDSSAGLKEYKAAKAMGFIPVGRKKGAVQLSVGFPHFLIAIKQKDLFISNYLAVKGD